MMIDEDLRLHFFMINSLTAATIPTNFLDMGCNIK